MFSGDLVLNNISETLADLQALNLQAPLTLDFSDVNEIDTVAISLILEIQRKLHHQQAEVSTVSVTGVPENLRSMMQLYGVDDFLLN